MKNYEKIAQLTAKRAGLISEIRSTEQEIRNVAIAIAAEPASETPDVTPVPRPRRARASKSGDSASTATGEQSDVIDPEHSLASNVAGPSPFALSLLELFEFGIPHSSRYIATLAHNSAIVDDPEQPLVRKAVREGIAELVAAGMVHQTGEGKGTVYTRDPITG